MENKKIIDVAQLPIEDYITAYCVGEKNDVANFGYYIDREQVMDTLFYSLMERYRLKCWLRLRNIRGLPMWCWLKIGLKVSYYRKLNGISQEELAEKIGKSVGFIGMIEAPGVNKGVSIKTLFDISSVLNVPIQKFFEEF